MSEATEKQISFAISLGIEDPKSKSKETLKVLIDEALKNRDQGKEASSKAQKQLSDGQIGVTNGISNVQHDFQSEYEFGPAGQRHKIKYRTIEELKNKMKELEEAGYFVEVVKV